MPVANGCESDGIFVALGPVNDSKTMGLGIFGDWFGARRSGPSDYAVSRTSSNLNGRVSKFGWSQARAIFLASRDPGVLALLAQHTDGVGGACDAGSAARRSGENEGL